MPFVLRRTLQENYKALLSIRRNGYKAVSSRGTTESETNGKELESKGILC